LCQFWVYSILIIWTKLFLSYQIATEDIYMELDLNNIPEEAYCDLDTIRRTYNKPDNPIPKSGDETVYFDTDDSDYPVYNEIPYLPDAVYFETYPEPEWVLFLKTGSTVDMFCCRVVYSQDNRHFYTLVYGCFLKYTKH